jgi:DNA-binding transcriptional LysR family regulator
MDLVLLQSLIAVASAGSITDAADQISLSQSALSRRLQQLEADLGAELLVRGRHGVELTALGRHTVEQGRGIVARYEALRQDLAEHLTLQRGTVRIGGGATATSYLLPPSIAAFQTDHPGIRFYVKEAGSREIAQDIGDGDLELGVVTLPIPSRDLDVTELLTDEIVLVARPDHPMAGRRVTVGDLDAQPFVGFEQGSAIRQIIDQSIRGAGVQIDVVMELRSIPSILRMVATTGNLAFVTRMSLPAEHQLRVVGVRDLSISRTLALATHRGIPLSPSSAAFATVLRSRAALPGR